MPKDHMWKILNYYSSPHFIYSSKQKSGISSYMLYVYCIPTSCNVYFTVYSVSKWFVLITFLNICVCKNAYATSTIAEMNIFLETLWKDFLLTHSQSKTNRNETNQASTLRVPYIAFFPLIYKILLTSTRVAIYKYIYIIYIVWEICFPS